jgi:hypothetical protein
MALPSKSRPVFHTTLPLSKEKVSYHPMRRQDEKILLMAKSSAQSLPREEQMGEILPAIKQLVEACLLPESKDIMKPLSMVDMEWLFIQIRMVSIDSVVPVTYHDPGDDKDYNFQIQLGDVRATDPGSNPHIDLGDGIVLSMRYPPATLYEDAHFLKLEGEDQIDALIVACMDKVFDGDAMMVVDQLDKKEALDFINDMDRPSFRKVAEFLDDLPSLDYRITYKNLEGKEREIVLTTLTDFFTFV